MKLATKDRCILMSDRFVPFPYRISFSDRLHVVAAACPHCCRCRRVSAASRNGNRRPWIPSPRPSPWGARESRRWTRKPGTGERLNRGWVPLGSREKEPRMNADERGWEREKVNRPRSQ
jgi:hypothetical protein